MEVVEAIDAVSSVAKLAFNVGKAVHEVAKISKDSSKIAQRLQGGSITLMGLIKLIESVRLSLTLKCPAGDASPVIDFINSSGVLDLLNKQCEELVKGMQDHQKTIGLYQSAIATDSGLGRRFFTTWKWKNTLVRELNESSAKIEALKSSLQLMVQLVHLEASELS